MDRRRAGWACRLGAVVALEAGGRGHSGAGGGERVEMRRLGRWALRSASRPEATQLLAELLSRGRPVGTDVIAQLLNMTLEVELVLLEPGDVQFLTRGSPLELAGYVLLVVADDPVDRRFISTLSSTLSTEPQHIAVQRQVGHTW